MNIKILTVLKFFLMIEKQKLIKEVFSFVNAKKVEE